MLYPYYTSMQDRMTLNVCILQNFEKIDLSIFTVQLHVQVVPT